MKSKQSVAIRTRWGVIVAAVLFGTGTLLATPPQLTNILASQRSGTKLVDITYTLSSDTPSCDVSVMVSTNSGATYNLTASNVIGNGYGSNVTAGAGKQIVWDAGKDWDVNYSTQVWFKMTAVERNTNALTFTQNTNISLDANQGGLWCQPVYDGTNIVASAESGSNITARKYDLDLHPVGSYAVVASTNDTAGANIADHKHVFQNNYHYLVFSISGSGDGGSLWLVKFDRNFTRIGITQVVTNEPPTNDMLLFGDGTYLYVGKFYPEGQAAHKIYKYDGNLNFIANYVEGSGSNEHANGDAAMYLDGNFYFVSPQYVGPGANDRYYRIVYDTNFNVVQSRSVILQDTNKLGLINGLSYYNGRFIVHYLKGSNEANPIARAVYDASTWNLIQNETIITGGNHNPHSVIVNSALYLGYTQQNPGFSNKLAKFTIGEVNPLTLVATGNGYVGPVTVNTLSFSSGVCADYDGDGSADPAVYDEVTGTWKVKLSSSEYTYLITTTLEGLGGPGYASVSADYDGDQKADPAVYQETTGEWTILPSTIGYAPPFPLWQLLGGPGYSAMPADYDGDFKADPGVYQRTSGDWQVLPSSFNYSFIEVLELLGGTGYRAVAADYDGDRSADPAVYEESTGVWQIRASNADYLKYDSSVYGWTLGGNGYIPVPADYDGDRRADPAVKSASGNEWIVMLSTGNYTPRTFTLTFE